MQWDGTPQAGFTTGQPWLPVAPEYTALNVDRELTDPASLLSLYKRLIALRRASPALSRGDALLLETNAGDCLVYERTARSTEGTPERMLVIVNFSDREVEVRLPPRVAQARFLLSTQCDAAQSGPITRHVRMRPDEGRLLQLEA
jgi:alpha-glucosidase